MAASATPWSKATVSQPVTRAEQTRPIEAPNESTRRHEWWGGTMVSPVLELVAWVGLGVVGVVLVACLQHISWSGSPGSTPAAGTRTAEKASDSSERAAHGFSVGRVVDNNGSTLRVYELTGGTTTVHTDAHTRVLVFPGGKVANVGRGSMIAVYGNEQPDGSIDSNLVVGLSMPR